MAFEGYNVAESVVESEARIFSCDQHGGSCDDNSNREQPLWMDRRGEKRGNKWTYLVEGNTNNTARELLLSTRGFHKIGVK